MSRQTARHTTRHTAPQLLVTEAPVLRRCPHPVAFVSELGAGPVARRLLGHDLAVGPVVDGSVEVDFAAVGSEARDRRPGEPTAEAALGLVWVTLEPGDSDGGVSKCGVPELPEYGDPAFRSIEIGVVRFGASAPTIIDNNTDTTHVAFVHDGSFGAGQDPRVPVSTVRRTGFGIEIVTDTMGVAATPGADGGDAVAGVGEGTDPAARRTVTEMWLPFTQIGRFAYSDGHLHVLFKALCPVDDVTTDVLFTVLRDDVDDPADDEAIRRFELTIEHEDRAVLESLPAAFELDPAALVHTAHDRAGIAYRRALADLVAR